MGNIPANNPTISRGIEMAKTETENRKPKQQEQEARRGKGKDHQSAQAHCSWIRFSFSSVSRCWTRRSSFLLLK